MVNGIKLGHVKVIKLCNGKGINWVMVNDTKPCHGKLNKLCYGKWF